MNLGKPRFGKRPIPPREKFDTAILKLANTVAGFSDINARTMLLSGLTNIKQVKSTDKNYERWAALLEQCLRAKPLDIASCLVRIKEEAG